MATVRVVHRVELPVDRDGRILADPLDRPGESPYPPGAVLVLDCGRGHWMYRYDVRRIAAALSHCGHITVTGTSDEPADFGADHIALGLQAIGAELTSRLDSLSSPLPAISSVSDDSVRGTGSLSRSPAVTRIPA